MDIKEIMEIDVNNLKRRQLNALKIHTIDILRKAIKHIENEEFEEIELMMADSTSGDAYGSDNHYIDFTYLENCHMDIEEVVELMKKLR